MDFDLSEEQRLLKESVDGLLTDAYDFEQRKTYMKEKGGWSKAVWGKLAEQGLLGLPFTEVGGGFLRHGGSDAQKAAYIPSIIDGSKTFAFAQLEKNSRYDLNDVATSAKKKGSGWVIDGEKFVVFNGDAA